jgi:hypothetical protein
MLRVPLLDNAIQLGTGLSLPAATIAVCTTESTVQVHRTDGAPLRVQIIEVHADGSVTRREVFSTPVDVLRLRRIRRPGGSRLWMVMVDTPAYRDRDVLQLVETVVSFAVAKQHRSRVTPGCATCALSPPRRAAVGGR